MVGGVDLAHAAAPDGAQDLIAAHARARMQLTDERPALVPGQARRAAGLVRAPPT